MDTGELLGLLEDPDALDATTVSGTVVLGLGPPILFLEFLKGYRPLCFHIPFWISACLGISYQVMIEEPNRADLTKLGVGDGAYDILLGVNILSSLLAFGSFFVFAFENAAGEDLPGRHDRHKWQTAAVKTLGMGQWSLNLELDPSKEKAAANKDLPIADAALEDQGLMEETKAQAEPVGEEAKGGALEA
mmetsp:Transcript_13832/g.46684  ORF Transcript_13832/g.46684 Transcript_13832/m.46684 type:complete len:190 (-) Transcript_13832:407-976(-)